jgi:hypothetical protein
MRRLFAVTVAAFLVLSVLARPAVARQATPPAGPDVGSTISILGTEGTEVATVAVTDLTDPFADYDPGSPPQRGFHFVTVVVTIANTGTRPFEVNPSDVSLVDADGFRYAQGGLYRGSESAPPDLEYNGELAPGDEATGLIGFQVLNGVEIAEVIYAPDSDRLISLVDRHTDPPAVGTTVAFLGVEGTEAGQITIEDVVDPFANYDPSSPPQRGSHYVLVTVTLANTGTRPLDVDPGDLYLVDADGFVVGDANIRRPDNATPPDFDRAELAPGAETTGVIGYQVLNGTTPAAVVYLPDNDRLITAAVLGEAAGPRPTPRAGLATVTPAAGATATTTRPTAAAIDCAAVSAWFTPSDERFNRLTQIVSSLPDLTTATAADVPAIRQAAEEIAALAEEQQNSQPPPEAEAFNDVIVTYLTGISQVLTFLADAIEAGDPAQQIVAIANLGELDQQFQTDGLPLFNELNEACGG